MLLVAHLIVLASVIVWHNHTKIMSAHSHQPHPATHVNVTYSFISLFFSLFYWIFLPRAIAQTNEVRTLVKLSFKLQSPIEPACVHIYNCVQSDFPIIYVSSSSPCGDKDFLHVIFVFRSKIFENLKFCGSSNIFLLLQYLLASIQR